MLVVKHASHPLLMGSLIHRLVYIHPAQADHFLSYIVIVSKNKSMQFKFVSVTTRVLVSDVIMVYELSDLFQGC